MDLVISAASKTSDVNILHRLYERQHGTIPHVRSLLVTPLLVSAGTVARTRRLRDAYGTPIMFDSGGYAVQTGRLDYFAMYAALLELYRRERWANLYTLPDDVPTSQDSKAAVEAKVRQTVECSALFYREMPAELRDRALGVVHGYTMGQVEFCLDRYVKLGLRHVGFGSFGTAGQNSSINIVTGAALANVQALAGMAQARGLTVHLFGVGSPAQLPWIARTGVSSFDSANWARSAGFGQVFLPLTRGYNVSHRSAVSTIQRGLTRADFERLRAVSGHACHYCESFEHLQTSREARAAHNLLATVDALDIIAQRDHRRMEAIYALGSPKYRTLWKEWMDVS